MASARDLINKIAEYSEKGAQQIRIGRFDFDRIAKELKIRPYVEGSSHVLKKNEIEIGHVRVMP